VRERSRRRYEWLEIYRKYGLSVTALACSWRVYSRQNRANENIYNYNTVEERNVKKALKGLKYMAAPAVSTDVYGK